MVAPDTSVVTSRSGDSELNAPKCDTMALRIGEQGQILVTTRGQPVRKMESVAKKLRNSGKILSHRAWCPQSHSWKTPVWSKNMVLPHLLCNVEDPTGQSTVSCRCDRAPVLSLSTTMTTSMGRVDLANYHYRNLRGHVALVVIIAAERFASPSLRSSSQCWKGSFPSLVAKRTQPQGVK